MYLGLQKLILEIMSSTNLWPSFVNIAKIKTPKIIVEEQANFLEKSSSNYIKAEVVTSNHDSGANKVAHVLKITAPKLDYYVASVVTVEHDIIKYYPVTITSRIKPMATIYTAHSDEEMLETLKKIFMEKETIETIESLLIQSKALDEMKAKL